jgi:6-phosphogluconolactonase
VPAPTVETEVFADADAASRRAAEVIAEAGREAVAARGEFTLALSGGRTPWRMVALLGDMEEMPWEATRIFQVDERVAPPGDEARNLTHLVQMLSISHQAALRPMPVTSRDLEIAAAEYEAHLPKRLDLVHLGLGPDGHTASLVPGDTVLEVRDRGVAMTTGEYQGHRRMTLTYPTLASARRILWLTLGEKVREPLAKLLANDPSIPAGWVDNHNMLVIADEAAAGDLPKPRSSAPPEAP